MLWMAKFQTSPHTTRPGSFRRVSLVAGAITWATRVGVLALVTSPPVPAQPCEWAVQIFYMSLISHAQPLFCLIPVVLRHHFPAADPPRLTEPRATVCCITNCQPLPTGTYRTKQPWKTTKEENRTSKELRKYEQVTRELREELIVTGVFFPNQQEK